ncbi:MAG: outer membrane protein [Gammaproteobacteria bacterium]
MKNLTTISTITSTALSTLLFMAMPAAYADDTKADDWTGNVSGYLGHKSVDDNDWPNLDSQGSIGVISDFGKQSWPVSIAADLIMSGTVHESGAQKDTGGTVAAHLGARKIFTLENSSFRPYVGGGVALIAAGLENENAGVKVDDDDSTVGAWVGAGTYYAVTPSFNIGLDVRYSKAEVTLFNKEREAGGVNAGITAGYHW